MSAALLAQLDQCLAASTTRQIDVPIHTPTSSAMPVVQFTERVTVACIPLNQWLDLVTSIQALGEEDA